MTESTDTDKIIELILILFLPPLAVWFHAKQCNSHVCLNVCLLFLFVIPSVIHAVWYCYMRDRNPAATTTVVTSNGEDLPPKY